MSDREILRELGVPLVVMLLGSVATGTLTHAVTVAEVRLQTQQLQRDLERERVARQRTVEALDARIKDNTKAQRDAADAQAKAAAELQRWMGSVDSKLDAIQGTLRGRR